MPAYVQVIGAKEIARQLRSAHGKVGTKALREAHKTIAKRLEVDIRGKGTRQQQKAAKAILGKATARSADIAIRNLSSVPFGLGAFLGAKQYRQFPAWVGNNWNIDAGEGPYVIAPTIASHRQQIADMFTDELRRAFDEIGLEWE
jgi:hypothetical protein